VSTLITHGKQKRNAKRQRKIDELYAALEVLGRRYAQDKSYCPPDTGFNTSKYKCNAKAGCYNCLIKYAIRQARRNIKKKKFNAKS